MSCRVIYLCSCHCIHAANLWKYSGILQAECTCTFHFIYFLFVCLSSGTITVKKWNSLINYSGFLWISSTEQCNLRERNICDLSIGLWLLEMRSNAFSSENNNLEKPVFGYAPSENQFTTYFPKSHKSTEIRIWGLGKVMKSKLDYFLLRLTRSNFHQFLLPSLQPWCSGSEAWDAAAWRWESCGAVRPACLFSLQHNGWCWDDIKGFGIPLSPD